MSALASLTTPARRGFSRAAQTSHKAPPNPLSQLLGAEGGAPQLPRGPSLGKEGSWKVLLQAKQEDPQRCPLLDRKSTRLNSSH